MAKVELVIRNGRIFFNDYLLSGGVAVDKGKIVAVCNDELLPPAQRVIDADDKLVLPGCIDPHVHFRDPGRPDRETFKSGTMAAAAGGVTTVIEHPISTPPQYSPEILKKRIFTATAQSVVDFAFYGAAGAEYTSEIDKISREGIVAYKTFLHAAPEGREEEFKGLTMKDDGEILNGFREVAKTGLICAIHAENNDMIQTLTADLKRKGKVSAGAHAESRPPICEIETVAKILYIAREMGVRIEFCHISVPEAMELVKKAKSEGQEVYLETCPHYLLLTEETLLRYGPFAKCNPPLRKKEAVERLWQYINDGTVDFIGSDHGPFLLQEKEAGKDDIFKSPAGFPGVDLRLPLMLNAVNEGRLSLARAVKLLCKNPATIFNLYPQKGAIQLGADADFAIVDMDQEMTVSREKMYSKAKDIAVVYDGWKLKGVPLYTIVRGRVIMENGAVDEKAAGYGELVTPCRS